MQVIRSVKEHINLGNYEWVEIGAEVSFEAGSQRELDAASHVANERLDQLLAADRRRYRERTDEPESMIHDHPALREA